MDGQVTIKIGGAAGQGIQTVGRLLALACQKGGAWLFALDDHESRIRGGHNFQLLRLSREKVAAPSREVHLLVALDKVTPALHGPELVAGGLVLADEGVDPAGWPLVEVPFNRLAEEAGGKISANTVAAGACLALLGLPLELFQGVLEDRFRAKGGRAVEMNLAAAELGYQAVAGVAFDHPFAWGEPGPRGRLLAGSQALALGALAGDLRFGAYYPMSPATDIMAHLIDLEDLFPLVIEQAEDEIAAVNLAIGASYAGVRAMTATSGGGFSLMNEGLGLTAMTETPLVIVLAQRPGPATGMATRTAQADLLFAVHASQDEFPRFVLAPGSVRECYETMARALNLADRYQVPVIVLADQYLTDCLAITDQPLNVPDKVERYLELSPDPATYRRYALTESGISPRALPGRGDVFFWVPGNEHREDGHPAEDPAKRTAMVDKRFAKLPAMLAEMEPPEVEHEGAETLLLSWGSTQGSLAEAVGLLRAQGHDLGRVHFRDLWPFPAKGVASILSRSKRFITVEGNKTGQLAKLIRLETGLKATGSITKYDGRPFYPVDIVEMYKERF